jgi:hypothetical protein
LQTDTRYEPKALGFDPSLQYFTSLLMVAIATKLMELHVEFSRTILFPTACSTGFGLPVFDQTAIRWGKVYMYAANASLRFDPNP